MKRVAVFAIPLEIAERMTIWQRLNVRDASKPDPRVLSESLRAGEDLGVGNVTITAVSVPRIWHARVYFTPFASIIPHEEVRIGLTHAGGSSRRSGAAARLRHARAWSSSSMTAPTRHPGSRG